MTTLLFLSVALLFIEPVFSMEEPPRITEQKAKEVNGPVIILAGLNNTTHKVAKIYLEQSTILKEMLGEMNDEVENFPIPQIIAESFDLIKPYFELAFLESQQNTPDDQKISYVQNQLINHSNEELVQIATAFNYLNIPLVTNHAHNLLKERYSTLQKKADLLKKDSQELQTTPDCKKIIAQGMLAKIRGLRSHWLTATYTPKEVPNPSMQIFLDIVYPRVQTLNSTGTLVATAYKNNSTIYVVDTVSGNQNILDGQDFLPPISLNFSPDNSQLASGCIDRTIRIWNLQTGALAKTISATNCYRQVCFNHDGALLASSGETDVCFWDNNFELTGKNILTFNTLIRNICFNHDSKKIALATSVDGIRIADVETGKYTSITHSKNGSIEDLTGVTFNLDSSLIATINRNNDLFLFDTRTEQEVAHFTAPFRMPAEGTWGNAIRFTTPTAVSAFLPDVSLTTGRVRKFQVADPELQKWFDTEIQPNQVALLDCIWKANQTLSAYDYYTHISLPAQLDSIARPSRVRWGMAYMANHPILTGIGFGLAGAAFGYKTLKK